MTVPWNCRITKPMDSVQGWFYSSTFYIENISNSVVFLSLSFRSITTILTHMCEPKRQRDFLSTVQLNDQDTRIIT